MTKYEKLEEYFTKTEFAVLKYFVDHSVPLNTIDEIPKNWRDWFGSNHLYKCEAKQADIANELGITPTAVSRSITLLRTYQTVTKIRGIKGYIVNKDWLYDEYQY